MKRPDLATVISYGLTMLFFGWVARAIMLPDSDPQSESTLAQDLAAPIVNRLCKKYYCKQRSFSEFFGSYTINLQRGMREQSFVFKGDLQDVFTVNGRQYMKFFDFPVMLMVEVPAQVAERAARDSTDKFSEPKYVVAVTDSRVLVSPRWTITTPDPDLGDDGSPASQDPPKMELDTQPVIVAKSLETVEVPKEKAESK